MPRYSTGARRKAATISRDRPDPSQLAPVLRELLSIYPTLPPAERKIADVIFAKPREVINLTTSELASRAEASQPGASRLCGRLATKSFQAFKVRLAQELGADGGFGDHTSGAHTDDLSTGSTAESTTQTDLGPIVESTRQDLDAALRAVATMDSDALVNAAEALVGAKTIVICGFDLSGSVAWRLASLIHRSGLPARPERDPNNAPWATDLGRGDVLMIVSYRGRVPRFIDAAKRAHERGATLVVLTNELKSEAAAIADILLLTNAPSARSNDEYATGPALYVQLAAARALWQVVHKQVSAH